MTPTPVDLADAPAALLVLDALVRKDARPPGFAASLAVGVQERMRVIFWEARFAADATTRFVEGRPSVDCLIVVEVDEADPARPGFPHLRVVTAHGDLSVVDRFAGRYGVGRSWLSIRAGGPR